MLKPPAFLQNQNDDEAERLVLLASACGLLAYVPFAFIYPLILGPGTVDPVWERAALALISCLGFLFPRFPQTRPWMQSFVYSICFVFTAHLFFLVCRNQLNIAYQMGYICTIALIAFYLDTNTIFGLYVLFNYLLLGCSLFFKISYENLFFGMIISTILGIEWLALHSRLRVMKALAEKNQKIRSILENIQQGVLTVESADGRVGAERSTHLYEMLRCDKPEELSHLGKILSRTALPGDQISQVLAAVSCIMQDTELAFMANYHLFPRSLTEGQGESIRYLELDWNPVYDKQGLIVNLLICIRDVTELQNLRMDAARGQQELTLLAELINIPRHRRENALAASRDLLKQVPRTLDASPTQILRVLHTLKGNARTLGLLTLAQAAHESETQIQTGQKADASLFEPLEKLLDLYRALMEDKLGQQGRRDDLVAVPRQHLQAAVEFLDHLPEAQKQNLLPLYRMVHASLYLNFQQILAPQLDGLPALAAELGKERPQVHIVDPGVLLQQESHELLRNAFLHLFRNSLDHGLESPAERRLAQKSVEGHLWLVLKHKEHGVDIEFHDDGRGLHLPAIEERAKAQGLIPRNAHLSPEAIADLIFHSGLSTKTKITDISGRGVGMDAVRAMLEDAGGNIRLVLDEVQANGYAHCTFILHLPHRYLAQRLSA